jgi:hypothetical protein
MVNEDDPQFARFWRAFPQPRPAKLDARVAWAQVNPSPDLVDRMIAALEWQSGVWARQGYGQPYPASWLRGKRWEDEPPRAVQGAITSLPQWREACRAMQHVPECQSADQHELRKLVKDNGCLHPGVCRSHGEHTQKIADERATVAS